MYLPSCIERKSPDLFTGTYCLPPQRIVPHQLNFQKSPNQPRYHIVLACLDPGVIKDVAQEIGIQSPRCDHMSTSFGDPSVVL